MQEGHGLTRVYARRSPPTARSSRVVDAEHCTRLAGVDSVLTMALFLFVFLVLTADEWPESIASGVATVSDEPPRPSSHRSCRAEGRGSDARLTI